MKNARRGRSCLVCSRRYNATYGKQRTCSRDCGAELRRREGTYREKKPAVCSVFFPTCPTCDVMFTARQPAHTYCSTQCYTSRSVPRTVTRRCCHCSASFTKPRADHRRVCDSCRTARRRDAKRRAQRRLRSRRKHRQRARKYGVRYEPVNPQAVYERDRWRCQLCGRKVDHHLVVPHPLAPTLDHVLPMSLGGDHNYANVQLAHFECNWTKGVGGTEQLALVG